MENFEKWFNKEYPLPPTIERGSIGRDFKNGCKETWKAALEMVLNYLDHSQEHKQIEGIIYEELEN